MRKKLRAQRGFSLTEMLTAVAILALLSTALAVGIPTAVSVYQRVTAHSEASVLCGTLSTALADELRQALSPDADTDSFYRAEFGGQVTVNTADGRVRLGSRALLGDKSYTSGLTASATADYEAGRFLVDVTVYGADGAKLTAAQFEIKPLNP